MKKNKNTIVIVITLASVLLGGYLYSDKILLFVISSGCDKQTINEVISSNGILARVRVVDCGATTDYSTWVTIKKSFFNNEEQVITIKGDHSNSCSVNWINENSLSIQCDVDPSELYVHKTEYEGIKVSYEMIK